MTTFRKRFVRIMALLLVAAMLLPLVACRQKDEDPTEPSAAAGEPTTYTVQIQSAGGMAMSGVGVYIYEDKTLSELVWFDQTDAEGKMTFTDVARDTYVAVLSDVPTGYAAEDFYPITGEITTIVLQVGQLDEENIGDLTYKLGDMMMDFTVTGPDGTTYTLSELLKQKKAVMLNFWYIGCGPCKAEFPYLQEAYELYSDDVAVLAMNHIDSAEDIATFQKENGYTFPMVTCGAEWQQLMKLTAYPTTVMVDRFGNICLIHKGTIDNAKTFKDTFAYFAAEDYEPKPVEDINELLTEEEEGSKDNPQDATGKATFQVEVEPGQEVFTELYKAKGMYLSIWGKNKDFYVLYNDKKYTPDSSGAVGFVISTGDNYTPSVFGIGNTGTEKQTFSVYLSFLEGTFNNPYKLKLGEFTAKVAAGNDQGIYYRCTTPEDGTYTIQCISAPAGVEYDFSLQSMDVNRTVLRNYGGDGNVDPETGYPTVRLQMKKGTDIMFSVGTLPDDSNAYPGGTFKFLLSFEAGEVQEAAKVEKMDYSVTVTDENDQPLKDITVWLTKDAQTASAKTDEQGVVTMNLEKGTYTGTVSVPEGYTLENNAFTLTEEAPTATVKLQTAVDTRVEYTVTVYDPEFNPAAGVEVLILGAGSTVTNEQGVAVFKLEPGNYSALTGTLPAGWEGADMLTLTAEQLTGEIYLMYALGMEQNPIPLLETNNTVTNAGTLYYSAFFNGAVMEVTGTGEYHVLMDGNTLTPVDGVVSQLIQTANPRMPAVFAIVGDGEFTLSFTYPAGHRMNPAPLQMGANRASQSAGASDYYYQWIAPGKGELTISMDETAQWIYSVSNLTTGVSGDLHWSDDETPVYTETLTVSEGDVIQVIVNTYDPANMFQNPAGDVVVTAAFVWTMDCEDFTTAPVLAGSSWNYRFADPEGATLTIESANAYVIYGNATYGADSTGKVVVALGSEAAAELTIGNMATDAESFPVSFSWPVGSLRNPQVLRFRFPQTITANLAAGDADGHYYVTSSTLLGTLTFTRVATGAPAADYTITLSRNNGEEIQVPAVENDEKIAQIYVFPDDELVIHVQAVPDAEGNFPAVSSISTRITFTEDLTTRQVTFDANGGTLTGAATAETVKGKLTQMPADPVRADYRFLGWFDAPEGGKQITTSTSIRSDLTIYAQWEKIEYTVTFDVRGGVLYGEDAVRTVDYKLSALPEAAMEGYTFLGWFDLPAGGNAITTETVFADNTTVYAQWKSESTSGDTGEQITYQVSVINEKGEPVTSGVYVTWQNADRMETKIINNASGRVSADLPAAQYTVMLTMTGAYAGYCYDAASAVTTAENRDVTIQIAKPLGSDAVLTDYTGIVTLDVPMGATYVKLSTSQVNYSVQEGVGYCFFRYPITEAGKYAVTTSNGAVVSSWGTNTFYIHKQTMTEEEAAINTLEIEIKDNNIPKDTKVLHLIFSVEVTGEFADTIVMVEDAGEAEWSIDDEPYIVYKGTQVPAVEYVDGKPVAIDENVFKLTTGGKTLTYVDMLNDKAVKGDDGLYHLGSKTGPVLYINLGENAPYISMGILTGAIGQYGTGFRKTFLNPDGTYELNPDGTYRKEDYTDAMIAYCLHVDPQTGVYPLNDDLIYMMQNGGEFLEWYDPESDTYLFKGQDITVDLSLAWMFAVCYLK